MTPLRPLLAALALAGCAADRAAAPPMTADETRAFLTAGPFACRQDEERWRAAYQPDGGYGYLYRGETFVGRWWLDENNRVCSIDDGSLGEQCFTQARVGQSLILTRESGESFECRRARS